MELPKGIESNFLDSVISERISEITADVVEAGIDQLITNEFLKDIPILGIGIKGYTLAKGISEMFFTKKILRFLFELKGVPKSERIDFIKKLEQNGKERRKVGETILIILDRLDNLNKASIVGKLFKASISGYFSYSDFLRLSHIVDKVFIDDLASLKDNIILYNVSIDIKENLALAGLLRQRIKDNRGREDYVRKETGSNVKLPSTFEYEVNSFGKLLINYGL